MAKILVVDDAVFIRLKMKQVLEANGHTVVGEAGDGKEAIDKYAIVKPDLVILDITMPGMGGIETLEHIRKLDPEARVLICSALGHQALIAEAIQKGAKNFVVKPFQDGELVSAVNAALN